MDARHLAPAEEDDADPAGGVDQVHSTVGTPARGWTRTERTRPVTRTRVRQATSPIVTSPILASPIITSIVRIGGRRLAAAGDGVGPGQVEVWVADEGIGVPDWERERVFEPFRRGGGSRSSGVGLAI